MSLPSPPGKDSRFQIASLLRTSTPEAPSKNPSKSREPLSPPVDQHVEHQHVAPARHDPRNLIPVVDSVHTISEAYHSLEIAVREWETVTNDAIQHILKAKTHDLENQRSELENQRSELENQRSEIENQRSEIENQRSEIENQRSELDKTCSKLTEAEIAKSTLEAELLKKSEDSQLQIDDLIRQITENREEYNRSLAAREAESQQRLSNQAQEFRDKSQKAFEDLEKTKKSFQNEVERSKEESRLSLNIALEREKGLEEELKKSTAEISALQEKSSQLEEAVKVHKDELRSTQKKYFDLGVEKGIGMGDVVKEGEMKVLRQMIVKSRSEGESEGFKAGKEAGYREGLEVANGQSNNFSGQEFAQNSSTLANDTIVVDSSIEGVRETSPLAQTEENYQAFENFLPQSKLGVCRQILLAFEDADGDMVKYRTFLRHAFRKEHYKFFHPYIMALEEWDWTRLPHWLEDADVTDPNGVFLKIYQDMAEVLSIYDYTTFQMAVLEYAQKHDLIQQNYQDSFNVRRLKVYLATCILEFWSKDLYFKRDIFYNSCLTYRLFEFAYCSLFAQESGSILGSNQRADAERREKALVAQNTSKTAALACSLLGMAHDGTVSCSPSSQVSTTGLPNSLKRSAPEQSHVPQKRGQLEPSSATIIDLRSASSSPTRNRRASTFAVEIISNSRATSEKTPTPAPTSETATKRKGKANKRYGY